MQQASTRQTTSCSCQAVRMWGACTLCMLRPSHELSSPITARTNCEHDVTCQRTCIPLCCDVRRPQGAPAAIPRTQPAMLPGAGMQRSTKLAVPAARPMQQSAHKSLPQPLLQPAQQQPAHERQQGDEDDDEPAMTQEDMERRRQENIRALVDNKWVVASSNEFDTESDLGPGAVVCCGCCVMSMQASRHCILMHAGPVLCCISTPQLAFVSSQAWGTGADVC